jgi:DNA-binding FadR family transcriptional regulator
MSEIVDDGETFAAASRSARRERSDKVAERVARRILRDIVTVHLLPGAQLPSEAQMLQRYKVGRASLREGLRILEVYGLIWIKPGPGGGPVVAPVSSIDFGRSATFFYQAVGAKLNELVESRLYLEPLMARLAAERLQADQADELRQSLEWEQAVLDSGGTAPQPRSLLFHSIVAGMTGNRLLSMFGQSILEIYIERVRLVPALDREQVYACHRNIGAAILNGQGAVAERLMLEHVVDLGSMFSVMHPGLGDEIIDWR